MTSIYSVVAKFKEVGFREILTVQRSSALILDTHYIGRFSSGHQVVSCGEERNWACSLGAAQDLIESIGSSNSGFSPNPFR